MPYYEYKCENCGREYELFQRITDPVAKKCKFCQGPIRKLISRTTFHLKGGGWYVTDYGGKTAPPAEAKESSSDKSVSSSSTSDAKDSASTTKKAD